MQKFFPTRQIVPTPPPSAELQPGFLERLSRMIGLAPPMLSDPAAPTLLRFVAGENVQPAAMADEDVRALGDVFSREVLLKGRKPLTLQDLARDIGDILQAKLSVRKMFVIAEGAQIAASGEPFALNARLVFTWQAGNNTPPDILVSTVAVANDPEALLQLIAWSDADKCFHFFERKAGAWAWAGNSFHALRQPSRGKGPFDSHVNGGLVMKELKEPWSHWHSMSASIVRDVFEAGSEFNTHPLFSDVEGAQALEPIVKAGVRRWTKSRFARDLRDGVMHSVPEYLRQVLWCTSFNLVSSRDAYRTSESEFDLPTSFFFDIDAIEYLAGAIDTMADVIPAKRLQMPTGHYRQAVAARKMAVTEDAPAGRKVDGDTHFAFLVPERAFEDLAVLKELVNSGVLSARLGLCLILVDFTNPVFSPDRAALLGYAPASVAAGSDGRALDEAFVDAIREKAAATGDDLESQLLMLWENTDLLEHVRTKLSAFHEVLTKKLATPAGVMDLLDLADSRREAVAGQKRSLAEFQSTFARADQPVEHLAIREDGSIFAKASELGEGEL